jgi:hypothetical protein
MPSRIDFKQPETGDVDPLKIPWVTWLDELIITFASGFGWSRDQILDLPYAAINDLRLALEYHKSIELGRMSVASNPSEKGLEIIQNYPVRHFVSKELEFKIYEANRKKWMRGG